ncbi:hypothetical protein FIV42_04390 [Persicimonas caeni]|uniref:Uncharacterized protein n=1 Tax=Persicimonas caeni TaxID=2292766 RepID=A0A4Y6PQE9_PERCE|nr:hypothetical protein [Persicimonas caeni]QDG50005.1 hypothetical protein FIV42_04390 [Persicimonas caeni]QED31226.1 hypothetical protein FRD00_04385 [Persicimonas caeni]
MLKKFLKFLKGTTQEQAFEGSYLDHLLEQVRPSVEAQLEECPEHDPLLVVVTEILRLSKPEQWTEAIECPLADEQSPELAAPAPPPAPADEADEADDSGEGDEPVEADADASNEFFEILEEEELEDDESEEKASDESDEADEQQEDSDSDSDDEQEEEHEDDKTAADGGESTGLDEESEAVHVDAEGDLSAAQTRPTAPLQSGDAIAAAEIVEEIAQEAILENSQSADDELEQAAAKATRLDSPEVLKAGRIFLGLLIENDRLPVDMQLSIAETMLARDLLLGYFVHDEQFEAKAKELLSLVEQKFNEGAFSQARILLQLFQTDRPTRINNDRNLFYEDMIMRLGIRRRHLLNHNLLAELEANSDVEDLDQGLAQTCHWLEENLHIKFHLFTRETEDVDAWRAFAQQSARRDAEDVFLRYIPPKRWRPLHASAQTPSDRMVAHISAATVKRYLLRQIKACYFVLRAVGDTGLEPYLDVFFDWCETKFEFNSVRLMPLIYRRTMSDTQLIDKIFEDAFRRFFQKKAAELLESFDEETIREATQATLDAIAGLDFNHVPPGNYDLGGLVLDRLFGLQYHEPEFAFKLHRLS